MGTHCYIAEEMGGGKYRSIFCALDGYPEEVGKKLIEFYKTPEKVGELLDLGDIYALEAMAAPDPAHPHRLNGDRQKDVTIAFGRDGDGQISGYEAEEKTLDELIDSDDDIEFIYVFTKGREWEVCPLHDYAPRFVKVSDILAFEGLGGHTQNPPAGPQMTMM